MALINCPECGKEISDKAVTCPSCGCPIDMKSDTAPTIEARPIDYNASTIRCPKCGARNISFQREQTATVGGSIHSFKWKSADKGRGCLYWLLIGWWIWIFKLILWFIKAIFHVCTLGIFLLLRLFKKKKGDRFTGKTVSAGKVINHTTAVCQSCGHAWKV